MARAADGESEPHSESANLPANDPADVTIDQQLLEQSPLLAQAVERCGEIKRAVRLKSPTLQALLNAVRLIGAEEQTLILAAPSIFHRTGITQAAHREILENVLTQLLNQPVTYRVEIVPHSVP